MPSLLIVARQLWSLPCHPSLLTLTLSVVARMRMDLDTALESMSAGNAYAAFEEKKLGRLTVGRLADFTVLAEDPRSLSGDALLRVGINMTVVGGKITYEAGE